MKDYKNDVGWTKQDVEDAIMSRLIPLKESGLEIDDPIVAKEIASYAYALAEIAYNKGMSNDKE